MGESLAPATARGSGVSGDPNALKVSIGQHSDQGRKPVNQDFYGASTPTDHLLHSKGVAIAIADGIGSSEVSQIAAEFAVHGFLDDYYCTSEAWSVKRSIERVLTATNSWLHSRTQQSPYRYDKDRGYVCTLSGLVIKSTTAHLFHVGDARVYRLREGALEQLTNDHQVWISPDERCLSRAVGFKPQIEIDYQALQIETGDVFVLATDGVHQYLDETSMAAAIAAHRATLDAAARAMVAEAYRRGSDDNLTVQIVAIEALPNREAVEIYRQAGELALPPLLEPRTTIDGYGIVRELHGSCRSHIYLAVDVETDTPVVLKIPSLDLRDDRSYLERLLTEDWVARRINSAHVVKGFRQTRERRYLYVVTEFIDGQTLSRWMIDNPKPDIGTVRGIVEQIASGLQAFHRMEMLHQDLRPDNVMIDRTGTVKIVDFGAASVAGISEMSRPRDPSDILGTAQYTAPEYFLGEPGTPRSDLFSLAVIAYQMLSGRLPFGAEVAKARSVAAQKRLQYASVLDDHREIPAWIDDVLRKAVHPDPGQRYETLSEFVYDLRHPSAAFLRKTRPPLVERDPVFFWKSLSALLAIIVFALLFLRFAMP
jgi:serine/threonine protein phosphatase PrpC